MSFATGDGSAALVVPPDIEALEAGPAGRYFPGRTMLVLDRDVMPDGDDVFDLIVSNYRLQDIADYRSAIAGWFAKLPVGGHLLIVVPHMFLCERRLALPSPWSSRQRRLYTARAVLEEIEEALLPNSYRLRLAADGDDGYDYGLGHITAPVGRHDVLVVVERIATPTWDLETPLHTVADPDVAFEPSHTRVEQLALPSCKRILILKLDHLGDFVMSVDALQRVRALFPDTEITLVVGSWNLAMARMLNVADIVVSFDAFPRNAGEEDSDVRSKGGLLSQLVPGEYDLAIDLRVDRDTRPLLRNVRANLRAGLGDHTEFPFLDIFLPGDASRQEPETARETRIAHDAFSTRGKAVESPYRIGWRGKDVRHAKGALVWGPYRTLARGDYIFEPHFEVEDERSGTLIGDIALDTQSVVKVAMPSSQSLRIAFKVDTPSAIFEFRIWKPSRWSRCGFNFYGGRLFRAGADNVLHQSEYMGLLVELIRLRLIHRGMLETVDTPG